MGNNRRIFRHGEGSVSEITVSSTGESPIIHATTNRCPIQLYLTCDDNVLSDYQCLVRKHIEFFEARVQDDVSSKQGRNKPVVLGQVGIRCRHCANVPVQQRARGSVYFPTKLEGIYQAAQNMATTHLCQDCQYVPQDVRNHLLLLMKSKTSSAGGGKAHWGSAAKALGVYEDDCGLRFRESLKEVVEDMFD